MSDLLTEMASSSRARADAALPLAELRRRAADRPLRPLRLGGDFDVIAEIKRRAPSAGALAAAGGDRSATVAARARAYAAAGAAAVSVLSEPDRFDGSLADVSAAADATDVPVMRKDFLVDPVQIWEARAAGASGVLLIVRMLAPDALRALCEAGVEAGVFVLLEAFDAVDAARAAAVAAAWPAGGPPLLVGVNTRDLVTLAVDEARLAELAPSLPAGPRVAESGLRLPGDAARARRLGYDVALVGTALMTAPDPGALLSGLLEAGRAGCG